MRQRDDVSRPYGIVAGSECGSASVACDIDRLTIPPLMGFISPAFVMLQIILYQNFRLVSIMPVAPPAKQSAGPYGLTTMPFWLGLYLPSIIGFWLIG